MTDYVRSLIEKRVRVLDGSKLYPSISATKPLAEATVLRRWLLNGITGLFSVEEIDLVLELMRVNPGEPIDPSEDAAEKKRRRSALMRARGELLVERQRRLALHAQGT